MNMNTTDRCFSIEPRKNSEEKKTTFAFYSKRVRVFCDLFSTHNYTKLLNAEDDRRPVGSVGRIPDYRAGGRGFKPWPDQHSGSLNN